MPFSQLRICMLSAHSCPVGKLGTKDTGGMSVYIREIASELGKQGHMVDVYTRVHDPQDRQIYGLGQNARLIHLRAGVDEEIHKLALYAHLPVFVNNLESFRRGTNLQYDLIFSHYWLSALAGTHLQRRWRVPHVAMFHTLGAVKNSIREASHAALGQKEPQLRIETESDLVRHCTRIIASTGKEKRALVRHYGAPSRKISVVPCGVNLERFRVMDRAQARRQLGLDGDKIILFVGRIDPLKGADNLIKALPHLNHIPKLRLMIIGGGEHSQCELDQLQRLAHNLEVQNLVDFRGLIKHEDLPYFYNAADACVVPSYYESFGLVALESLACGTPVVATDVGNHKNLIREGDTGYVTEDNDPWRLADKIALLLSRSESNAKSAQSIRGTVSNLSWSSIAEEIAKDCRFVLAKHAALAS
jgi:D-inositol-3-phosphate glycosyltransferase